MLYYIADLLSSIWGPLRMLKSHVVLLSLGVFTASLATIFLLPKFWRYLPHDKGKALCKDVGGNLSAGKPTGAGFIVTLVILPIILIFAPLAFWDMMAFLALYGAMLAGYLDDKSPNPWSRRKKLLLDAVISVVIAIFVFMGHADNSEGLGTMLVWLPFVKGVWHVPLWVYLPVASFIIVFTLNATNCSDGVDGLAGTLTLVELVMLAIMLYVVVGYRPVAHYFLIPCYAEAAKWAIVLMTTAGAFAGYLWYNAEPSKILMGDAGSRFLGALIATASLMTGNPLLIFALAPVIIVNGGGGLLKIFIIRLLKCFGVNFTENSWIMKIRFPLHDHCRKKFGWSNAQVLMRFTLMQLVIMPILLILIAKVR
ncbi:MAG: phospho-N-acetylmuramoyl-pentapeptide-transferase [Kiritimatiellae bacterium]|nr:phospho-N-acetylmuramoyl-pentapeptide-transferase [Kiritimatiellia bacterium]